LVARDRWLGIRDRDGTETWREFPFVSQGDAVRLFEVGAALTWFRGDAIAVSIDGGATWRQLPSAIARPLVNDGSWYGQLIPSRRDISYVAWFARPEHGTIARLDPIAGTVSVDDVHVSYRSSDEKTIAASHRGDGWHVGIPCRTAVHSTACIQRVD